MSHLTRRGFLAEVGQGTLLASLGLELGRALGFAVPTLLEDPAGLVAGDLEALVRLMQETPPERLLPDLVARLGSGAELRQLVAAAALANARSFGGEDYEGYHAAYALMPCLQMAQRLEGSERPLPVLKVLWRNSARIQAAAKDKPKLQPVAAADSAANAALLREQERARDVDGAEATFRRLVDADVAAAYDDLQVLIQDEINVHRITLAWRAWDLLQLTGMEHAHTLLRQCVRFCIDEERARVKRGHPEPGIRKVLPALIDRFELDGKAPGRRAADDAWITALADRVFRGSREAAAEEVAGVLADGFDPEAVGEAISLAAYRLLLHDPGQGDTMRVHGATVGVHAADAAHAWRNVARVVSNRHKITSLVVGAYHTAGQAKAVGAEPYPYREAAADLEGKEPAALLAELEGAIRERNQPRAGAAAHCLAANGSSPDKAFDLLLRCAVEADGALHAEKFFRTVFEDVAAARPAFRAERLVALARVSASAHGQVAPGLAEARRLLGV